MGLSTNATYLDQRKARVLLESGLDFLVISMDGASPDTYERIRVGGDFSTTLRNVRGFFELRHERRSETVVVVQMIVSEANRHEVDPFARLWAGVAGAQVMIKEARDWAGQVNLGRLVSIGLGPGREQPPQSATPAIHHVACRMMWSELTVLWDGDVVPCVNVFEKDNVLGNLARQSLEEVWNGPAMRRLRGAHLADDVGDITVCATCPRHPFDHQDFVATDQLAQRHRNYVRADLTPRPGLS